MIFSIQFFSGYPVKLKGIKKDPVVFNGWTNILYGPNGSGKTTILKTLAELSGCGGGGWSGTDPIKKTNTTFEAEIKKDNMPVFYQDCYTDSEKSFIDIDFLESNAHLRSSGEKRIGLVNELIDHIEETFPTYKLDVEDRPTLLLDEVDNHVGFMGQAILWKEIFPKLSKKYQLIISTHSIFPVLLKNDNSIKPDNLIILAERYAEVCVEELAKAIAVFNEK